MPLLKNSGEISFLFLEQATPKGYLNEMIDHCKANKHSYLVIGAPKPYPKLLALLFPIPLWFIYKRKCREFLKSKNPTAILAITDTSFHHNCLFKLANQKGVRTFLIQWTPLASPRIRVEAKKAAQKLQRANIQLPRRIIKQCVSFYNSVLMRYLAWVLGFDIRKLPIMGLGPSQKLGVINQHAYQIYKEAGVNENKMTIIGSMDFDSTINMLHAIEANPELKSKIKKKYSVDDSRINIALYSIPFNTKDVTFFTKREQMKHFYGIALAIREIFPEEGANILLKIHPAENIETYKPLEFLGVKVYGKDTINEELIYFVDLFISYPSTSNYVPIIMNKDAIFINLLKFSKAIGEGDKASYGIKKIVYNKREFKKLLKEFKQGKLKKQYTADHIIADGRCAERIKRWLSN